MFSKHILSALFLISSISLISCGGGGGGEGGSEIPNIPEPPINPERFITINGYIHIGSQINSYPEGLVSVVEITSVDKSGKEIDRKSITSLDGRFAINVGLNKDGGSIVLSVKAEGYTPGTKTVHYRSPEDFKNLMIDIEIDPVVKKIISINEIRISSKENKVAKINFFEEKNGNIYSSISTSSTDTLRLSVAIPVKKLQKDTDKLLVEYKGYKPSIPDDYQNFPGEETEDGNELVSVGFFTLKIKDPKTGKNPFVQSISPKLVKGKGEYYRLLSFVDCNQLLKIKNLIGSLDEDPDKEGIQLTFYAFNTDTGKWVKAGTGVFVSSANIQYDKFGEDLNRIDTDWDYILFNGCVNDVRCSALNTDSQACIDVNNDGKLEDVSCEGHHIILNDNDICTTYYPVYAVISVTDPELEWKNLDYIKPKTNKLHFRVLTKDEDNNPVATFISLIPDNDNACLEYTDGYTSESTGSTVLETLKYCNNTTGYIEYINPFTGLTEKTQTLLFHDNDEINIQISNPLKCKVKGRVVDESGKPKPYVPVTVFSENTNFYRGDFTDNDGKFEFNVLCETPISVLLSYDNDNIITTTVDNDIQESELSDNGREVVLKTIHMENEPPQGYGYLSTYATKWGSTVEATVVAWDTEEDLPIRYKLKILDGGKEIKSYTGEITQNSGMSVIDINTAELPQENRTYKIRLVLVDSGYQGSIDTLSNQKTEVDIGFLTVSIQNSPPVITYFYVIPQIAKVGESLNLYGYGYDIDGDVLTSQIMYECKDNDNSIIDAGYIENGNDILISGYTSFTIPDNRDIKYCDFTWILSDGTSEEISQPVRVQIKNQPPNVYIWPEKEIISSDEDSVKIYASVYDPDGDQLECRWYVNGVLDNDVSSCDEYTLDLSKFEPIQDITVTIEVSDGEETVEKSTTVHYGNPGNLNIIIQ